MRSLFLQLSSQHLVNWRGAVKITHRAKERCVYTCSQTLWNSDPVVEHRVPYWKGKMEGLSTDVFEPRTATGRQLLFFSGTFSTTQMNWKVVNGFNVSKSITYPKEEKILLPAGGVRCSTTSVLKVGSVAKLQLKWRDRNLLRTLQGLGV